MATIRRHQWEGEDVFTLENENFELSVVPGIGSNVYRLYDRIAGRDVLRVPDRVESLRKSPGHYGIPLLLPPSRIRNATFSFRGKTYRFQPNTPDGQHFIHGFVRARPWNVVKTDSDADAAEIVTEFQMAHFPEVLAQYPHALTIRAHTRIQGNALIQTFVFANESAEPAPFGFGLHTWFRLDGKPEAWTLKLPVVDRWEFDDRMLATGRRLPLGPYQALNEGLNLQGQNVDAAFRIGGQPAQATLAGPECTIRYTASDPVTQWVVYTAGEAKETICIEPLTWTPDAPNLDAEPELTGLRAIEPGGELKLTVTLEIER